jgi:hypothetical protein
MVHRRQVTEHQRLTLLQQRVDRQHLLIKALADQEHLLTQQLLEQRDSQAWREELRHPAPLTQQSFQFQMLTPGRPEPSVTEQGRKAALRLWLAEELSRRNGQPTQPPTSPSSES